VLRGLSRYGAGCGGGAESWQRGVGGGSPRLCQRDTNSQLAAFSFFCSLLCLWLSFCRKRTARCLWATLVLPSRRCSSSRRRKTIETPWWWRSSRCRRRACRRRRSGRSRSCGGPGARTRPSLPTSLSLRCASSRTCTNCGGTLSSRLTLRAWSSMWRS